MKITVTQEHIDKGDRCRASSCPLALALRETTGQPWIVSSMSAGTEYGHCRPLPQEARHFVVNYDHGALVKPFAFDFDIA